MKLKLALPSGSLNNSTRGNTNELFKTAGYQITGYEPGQEEFSPRIGNDPELELLVDRPRDIPMQIDFGVYDAGILGLDAYKESGWEGMIQEVCDLGYGRIRIVSAGPYPKGATTASVMQEYADYKSKPDSERQLGPVRETRFPLKSLRVNKMLFRIATEYPLITKEWVDPLSRRIFFGQPAQIQAPWNPYNLDARLEIAVTTGKTEQKARTGFADLIVEATQSGRTLERAGLTVLDEIMTSTARLYARTKDSWKEGKIREVATMLMAATGAMKYMIVMNVPEDGLERVANFLRTAGYCAKEPTVSRYNGNCSVETAIPRNEYPQAVRQLLMLGADDIYNSNTGAFVQRDAVKWRAK
ncbi:hypothetical protein HYY74_00775 [Candidatus Woesearchaeota archaeon]|nr:hypothetical protein [Candidatus Woesearchaeota archaeon]